MHCSRRVVQVFVYLGLAWSVHSRPGWTWLCWGSMERLGGIRTARALLHHCPVPALLCIIVCVCSAYIFWRSVICSLVTRLAFVVFRCWSCLQLPRIPVSQGLVD